MKLVQFGAGNIGRSFIGSLFSRAGWEVVFVDMAQNLVSHLNEKQYYTVVIKREGREDEERLVGPVRAVDGRDAEQASEEIACCNLLATSVGKDALPKIMGTIAAGLEKRRKKNGGRKTPLDIIIAENARDAKNIFLEGIRGALRDRDFPLERLVGLAETSIGKMVPLVKKEDIARDPLRLFAEEYETLIVDRKAFHGAPPDIAGLKPVENIAAWVDRKLFVHNLGHAAAAYLGWQADHSAKSISAVLRCPGLTEAVRQAMNASADALALEYPESYSRTELAAHIDDLIFRFGNSALGDTVFRVGRDLKRKLAENDRITGAMLLCARHGIGCGAIARVYRAALGWKAADDEGKLFPADEGFYREFPEAARGAQGLESDSLVAAVSGLDGSSPEKKKVLETLRNP
jgi:mannitol-1-phosphate 5-dehydrogenase